MKTEVSHHAARCNGVKLHYVRAGSGPPLVLLHGWPQTWYMWRKVIPLLGGHYTVIAPDLRGFGDSSKPVDGFEGRNVAEDIWQLVQQLGFDDGFHLVGHDVGGTTAYTLAWEHPEAVRKLCIVDVPITIDEQESNAFYRHLFHLSFNARPDIAVALIAGRERTYLTHFYRDCYNPGAFSHEDVDEYVTAFSQPGAMRASMAHYAVIPKDVKARASMAAERKLAMPVLALGGAMSFGAGVVESLKQVADDVRGGVIEGCAHWVAEEQPEAFCSELLAFLES